MATDRKAEVTWHGDLMSGSGRIDSVTSGAVGGLDVSWPARSEEPGGMTSPEELIAAAHATCLSMALSHGLAQEGHTPEELKTSATVTFQPGEGITKIALDVSGRVPGIEADAFEQAAEQAKENCPVSKALASVPEISLRARLES
jgi:osmotically inducible protein OsmC